MQDKTLKSILVVLALLLAASGFLYLFGTNERPIYDVPPTKAPSAQEAA